MPAVSAPSKASTASAGARAISAWWRNPGCPAAASSAARAASAKPGTGVAAGGAGHSNATGSRAPSRCACRPDSTSAAPRVNAATAAAVARPASVS